MSIYRRKSDGRVGRHPRPRTPTPMESGAGTSSTGALRREVVAKLEEARNRLAADEPVKDAKQTVGAFVSEWLEKALPASGRRPTTQATYAALARTHLIPAPFGALPLDRLRPSDIEALLLAKRNAGLAEWSIRGIYTVTRRPRLIRPCVTVLCGAMRPLL